MNLKQKGIFRQFERESRLILRVIGSSPEEEPGGSEGFGGDNLSPRQRMRRFFQNTSPARRPVRRRQDETFNLVETTEEDEDEQRRQREEVAENLVATSRSSRERLRRRVRSSGERRDTAPPQDTNTTEQSSATAENPIVQPTAEPIAPVAEAPLIIDPDVTELLEARAGRFSSLKSTLSSAANRIAVARIGTMASEQVSAGDPTIRAIANAGKNGASRRYVIDLYARTAMTLERMKTEAESKIQSAQTTLQQFGFRLTQKERNSSTAVADMQAKIDAVQALKTEAEASLGSTEINAVEQRDQNLRIALLNTGKINADELDLLIREHVLGIGKPLCDRLEQFGITDFAFSQQARGLPRYLGYFPFRKVPAQESMGIPLQMAYDYEASRLLMLQDANPPDLTARLRQLSAAPIGQPMRFATHHGDTMTLGIVGKTGNDISLRGRAGEAVLDIAGKRLRMGSGPWQQVDIQNPRGTDGTVVHAASRIPHFRLAAPTVVQPVTVTPIASQRNPQTSPRRSSPSGRRRRRSS